MFLLFSRRSDLEFETQARFGQRSRKFFTPQILPEQICKRREVASDLVDQRAGFVVTIISDLLNIGAQLSAASFQIFNQQRIAFDTRHNPRHDEITSEAE